MEEAHARRAHHRVTQRGDALRKRRAALSEFLYTVPFQPVAGRTVRTQRRSAHACRRRFPPALRSACRAVTAPADTFAEAILTPMPLLLLRQVEVYYNPEHTPLRGRPNIYVRYGFNR